MNHHWRTVRLSDLTTDLVASQSSLDRTMIIGIDGHSASGKTTLATRLGVALPTRESAGEMSVSGYRGWMAEENAYVIADLPWLRADLITEGGDSIAHDRVNEVVVNGSDD